MKLRRQDHFKMLTYYNFQIKIFCSMWRDGDITMIFITPIFAFHSQISTQKPSYPGRVWKLRSKVKVTKVKKCKKFSFQPSIRKGGQRSRSPGSNSRSEMSKVKVIGQGHRSRPKLFGDLSTTSTRRRCDTLAFSLCHEINKVPWRELYYLDKTFKWITKRCIIMHLYWEVALTDTR